jgi:hypothetical protein
MAGKSGGKEVNIPSQNRRVVGGAVVCSTLWWDHVCRDDEVRLAVMK